MAAPGRLGKAECTECQVGPAVPDEPRSAEPSSPEPGLPEPSLPEAAAALAPADLEACLALDGRSLGGLWNRGQWSTELADPQRPGLGLWSDGRLEAMACGWRILEELHITLVAVDPQRRRLGLGRLVLGALLAEARAHGAEWATLEVGADNTAALALYRRLGFRQAGHRPGYYRNGEDALILWLRLENG
jgi:[ribosomal protein S18]-alanine N-acetyltransferase